MEQNRFGLSRRIPEEVKRAVRQAARFGCVCCGGGIGTYEHIEPEFADARNHDPEAMAYLCGSCHLKVTRKIWSKERIWEGRRRPWCEVHGGPHEAFDIGATGVAVWLGLNRIADVPTILQIAGNTLFRIDGPECDGAPYRISGRFYDSQEQLLFTIDRNEWLGEPDVWDIECIGARITIRKAHRSVALKLCAVPPYGIVVEQADFPFRGSTVHVDTTVLRVVSPTGGIATVSGQSVVGDGENSVFLSVNDKGQYEITGPLTFKAMQAEDQPRLPPVRVERIGRNDDCPCGSRKKYKKCHGA